MARCAQADSDVPPKAGSEERLWFLRAACAADPQRILRGSVDSVLQIREEDPLRIRICRSAADPRVGGATVSAGSARGFAVKTYRNNGSKAARDSARDRFAALDIQEKRPRRNWYKSARSGTDETSKWNETLNPKQRARCVCRSSPTRPL